MKAHNWQDWHTIHKNKIKHFTGFKEQFITQVLSQISKISPHDVIPQYRFTDVYNKVHHVDFMIINADKNYLLPIELDDYCEISDKGDNYYSFDSFLQRQNAIINKFGLVLRYPNKKMLDNGESIVQELNQALADQALGKSIDNLKKRHVSLLIHDYEDKLTALQSKQQQFKNGDMLVPLLTAMQIEINTLKKIYPAITESTTTVKHDNQLIDDNKCEDDWDDDEEWDDDDEWEYYDDEPNHLLRWIVVILVIIILAVVGFIFINQLYPLQEKETNIAISHTQIQELPTTQRGMNTDANAEKKLTNKEQQPFSLAERIQQDGFINGSGKQTNEIIGTVK